jgi:hypothetical protein
VVEYRITFSNPGSRSVDALAVALALGPFFEQLPEQDPTAAIDLRCPGETAFVSVSQGWLVGDAAIDLVLADICSSGTLAPGTAGEILLRARLR